jgi:tetratricopeptide (TPR) repeat protein
MEEEERDISELLKRYEQMRESGKSIYFDAEEFEELAAHYDMLSQLDTAREIIQTGLKIHPESSLLLLANARFMIYDEHYQKALDYLNETFEGYDFDLYLLKIECLLRLEQPEEACLLVEELLDDDGIDEDIVFAELGYLYSDTDYFDDAILFYEQSLKINPENIDVLTELSYAYEMCENFDKAITVTNKILDIDPYAYDAWINIGKYYTMQDEYEKAIDAFDFALTINDSIVDVLKLKAHCLSLSGRMDEAITLFEECIAANHGDETLYYFLADCYFSMERYDDMLYCLNKYEELHGKTAEIFARKALAWLQKENIEQACLSLASGMLIDPLSECENLNIVTGELYFRMNELRVAEYFFLHAYEKGCEDGIMLDRLSLISIKKNDMAKAIEYTEKLADLDAGLQIRTRLALLYFEANDKKKFNQYLKTFSDEELKSLVSLFFSEEKPAFPFATRDVMINKLNDARERRQLFKNIVY